MSIEVRDVSKKFGGFEALKNIDLKVETGELVALLGPSGSGKTTLLRIVAGLETPDGGGVYFGGEDATDTRAKDRQVGFVFQHYALFRHMTVFENIAFGLRVKPKAARFSDRKIREKVHELLRLVQLDWVAECFPSQLSGGQRQRIALARALAVEPRVLLLDEPFGSLDAKVRRELRQWLRRFHDDLHITSLFVTHDQEEALEVADRVVVMNQGGIEQIGTPEEVYHHPLNPFVLNFLGNVNLFHTRVEDAHQAMGNLSAELAKGPPPPAPARPAGGGRAGAGEAGAESTGKGVTFYVRPDQFEVSRNVLGSRSFKARVKFLNPAGSVVKTEMVTDWGAPVQVNLTHQDYKNLALKKEEEVYLTPKEIRVESRESNRFTKVGFVQGGGGI